MANTKYNFNAIRPVIIVAHNSGNTKAITADLCKGAEVSVEYFNQWKSDVNQLRNTVLNYVQKRKDARFNTEITEGDIYAAREMIYPKWKEILHCGEADKVTKELHVDESDIEDLIGFSWDFFATSRGTTEAPVNEQIFRKKVEALLGCAIAKNVMLTLEEKETLDTYRKAADRIQKCIDEISDIESQIKNFESMKLDSKLEKEENFLKFIDNKITELKEMKKGKETSKADAEETLHNVSTKAKNIESKLNKITIK